MMRVRVSHYLWSAAVALLAIEAVAIRPVRSNGTERKTAVFALGCFWRGEAVFGCLPGVMRTRVGYAGGSKQSPDYHSIGDHAESVEVEYDPTVIQYEQLLEVFWANHDPSQVFGQGPDVGNQYRSVIFTPGGEEEAKLAMASRQREQLKLSDKVMTEIQPLQAFYPAEPEHQKFELRRKPQLLQLLGDMVDEELISSTMAAKLNGYAAGLCPSRTKMLLDTKVFGQGPDVGNQYRSVIFTSGEEEAKLAMARRQREQPKLPDKVMTEVQPLQAFYPAEPEHQKFQLQRKFQLIQCG